MQYVLRHFSPTSPSPLLRPRAIKLYTEYSKYFEVEVYDKVYFILFYFFVIRNGIVPGSAPKAVLFW